MSYQDHLMTCSYCNGNSTHNPQKPTVRIKAGSNYRRERKLSELASIIRGVSYPGISYVGVRKTNSNTRTKTKGLLVLWLQALKDSLSLRNWVEWLKVFRKRPSIDYWFSLMSSHEFCKIYPTYVLEI